MPSLLIRNPSHLEEMITKIAHDGKEHFHVIADFDRTLTTAFVNGEPRSSLESIFEEEEQHLGEEFARQSKEIFEKYYPIEIDLTIPLEEKKAAMHEWRTRIFALRIKAGITKDMIQHAMQSDKVRFRSGHEAFFKLLNDNNIPLLIFSASGLGYDGIYYCMKHRNTFYPNIGIISNRYVRDKNNKAIGVKEPIIHSFNKGETVVKDFPIYEKIKDRKNILLLGDSLGDVHMADGYDYQNIIKIGFLNHDTPENRAKFQKKFDLVILNDGTPAPHGDAGMDEVNTILQKILKK